MLQKSVLATLVYYDTLDYPLTEFEVWKHLLVPEGGNDVSSMSLVEVIRSLAELRKNRLIEYVTGFVTLPGRSHLVAQRIQQEKNAVEKLKRAARLVRWCSFIPYVRMIALTGSLSMKQGNQQSDWDFFVILKGGAIWTGRLFLTLWLELLGKRRHGNKVRDRACLNCYLTDQSLEVPLRDLFSSHEYRFFYPVVGLQTLRIFELANRWMQRYRPNLSLTEIPPVFLQRTPSYFLLIQKFLERITPVKFLEPIFGRWQQNIIARNPKTNISGGFIEANNRALVFLPKPKGPEIFERFKKRLSEV